jgi:hypothetical protein
MQLELIYRKVLWTYSSRAACSACTIPGRLLGEPARYVRFASRFALGGAGLASDADRQTCRLPFDHGGVIGPWPS